MVTIKTHKHTLCQPQKRMFERIKKLRKFFNLTQQDFAEKIGISYRALQNYEKGDRLLPTETVAYLYTHLGVNPVWLLVGEGDMLCDQSQGVYDNGAEPPARVASQDAGYFPERRGPISRGREIDADTRGDRLAEILVLLARIIETGRPNLVEMVATYLGSIATLIDDDASVDR